MTAQNKPKKILYAASTASHLRNFHEPYIKELRKNHQVLTMANGDGVDLPIAFDKSFFSLRNLRSIFKIRKILKRERFDALILHTSLAAFLVRVAMLGLKNRPYVLNVVHGYLFRREGRGLRRRVLLLCERVTRGMTDAIAVMNQEDLEIAREHKLCRGRISMINGMGIAIPERIPERNEELRTRYTAGKGDFLCCFVGELSRRKNQQYLLHTAVLLRESGVPIHLLLIGEGTTRAELEEEIRAFHAESYITLCGATSNVRAYLSAVDLYVSASTSEGLPFNVMEAMSCGLPIIASDIKGQSDLLRNTDGILYRLSNSDAFYDAVRRVYESGEYGVGSVFYPNIEKYRLSAVFDENMRVLKEGWDP